MSGTILVVDDVATSRIMLKVRLSEACYETLQASDGKTALAMARRALPDLILLDLNLPDMTGIDVCARLRADPATCAIPVIMLTASRDPGIRRAALRAGVEEFLDKPVDDLILLARIRSLLRARATEDELRLRGATERALGFAEPPADFSRPGTIALIAARRIDALRWRCNLLGRLQHQLVVIPHEAALADQVVTPEVFMIAADLKGSSDGLRLMSELRSRPGTRRAAFCIVLGANTPETGAMALDLGANDLLPAEFDPEEAALRLCAQLRQKRQAERLSESVRDGLRLAVTDPLTGLFNRRYALPHLNRIAERAKLTGQRYAVMVLDLDHFKEINDSWGHAAGDAVLAETTRRLRENLRPVDLLARIGGDEFLVAMPDAGLGTARIAAERLCRVIEEFPVILPDKSGCIPVTLSIGLAIGCGSDPATRPGASVEAVLQRADKALLAAKASGRNNVHSPNQAA